MNREESGMRKLQKILIGTFLGSILLGGIGTGVAFVEYSSFAYAGEKQIGQGDLVTRELDFQFEPEKGMIRIVHGIWEQNMMEGGIEADESVPEGTVRYIITYNEKRAKPFLEFEESKEGEGKEHREQGYLLLRFSSIGNDLQVFMESKEEFLREFKEKKISHYDVAYVTGVAIKVHPSTLPYLVTGDR